MSTSVQSEARAVIRSYSFEVEQRLRQGTTARTLGQALVQARAGGQLEDITSPWRCFFENQGADSASSDPIVGLLNAESARLREKWVLFYRKSAENDRLDMRDFEPTIEGVVSMITNVTTEWQSTRKKGRIGQAKTFFHKFCGTLKSHSSLLKLLPESNEYVAIFAGSLNAIIKASANHEKIAESLAKGLYVISERLDEAGRDLALFKTDNMKQLVANLYEHIFLFLNGVMDWILKKRSRRLLDSFVDDFNDRFEDETMRINDKAARIRILASQSSWAESRVTRQVVEGLSRDVRLGLDGQERIEAEMRLYAERMVDQVSRMADVTRRQDDNMRLLGEAVKVLLEADAQRWLTSQAAGGPKPAVSNHSSSVCASSISSIKDVARNSRQLEDCFSRDQVRVLADTFGLTPLGQEAVTRLEEWAKGYGSRILWLEGPVMEMDELENPFTAIAAKFIHLAETHHLNVISYFCGLPRGASEQHSPEESATISLLYALLRQTIEILSPCLETTIDFSEDRFGELNGTLDTWSKAVALFRDVLSVIPGIVFCVIDGLDWLDSKSTDTPLAELLSMLRNDQVRVLFTTSGRCGCLLENLEREETCTVERFSLRHSAQALDWDQPPDEESVSLT